MINKIKEQLNMSASSEEMQEMTTKMKDYAPMYKLIKLEERMKSYQLISEAILEKEDTDAKLGAMQTDLSSFVTAERFESTIR